MIYILLAFFLICLYGIRFSGGFSDYFGREETTAIKGIFAFIIMCSHFLQYITVGDTFAEAAFASAIKPIGQLMVVMFLFFSGYGIYVSAQKKDTYFDTFFRKRILSTLFYFDIAVLLFGLLGMHNGRYYPLSRWLISLTGWQAMGNSSWFIFCIVWMYIITYIVCRIRKNRLDIGSILCIFGLSLVYIFVVRMYKDTWWYNTALCYSAGMAYGCYKNQIDLMYRDTKKYALIVSVLAAGFLLCFHFRMKSLLFYLPMTVLFCLLLSALMYKIKIKNKCLLFLGTYSYDIYLIQRIPAGILARDPVPSNTVYFCLFIILTLLMAPGFHQAASYLSSKAANIGVRQS